MRPLCLGDEPDTNLGEVLNSLFLTARALAPDIRGPSTRFGRTLRRSQQRVESCHSANGAEGPKADVTFLQRLLFRISSRMTRTPKRSTLSNQLLARYPVTLSAADLLAATGAEEDLPEPIDFTPVPRLRNRRGGWSEQTQPTSSPTCSAPARSRPRLAPWG